MVSLTPTQINKLGDRLRGAALTEADLRLLSDYRNSFAAASSEVLEVLRDEFHLTPTARPAKSTRAILAKLQRESTRLSTMQDIAGCRVVVNHRLEQRTLILRLIQRFPSCKLIDRISRPSHGYRALHLVVRLRGRCVEIQVRTELQHLWAQVCESMADRVGIDFKYGGGSGAMRRLMDGVSDAVNDCEAREELNPPELGTPPSLSREMLRGLLQHAGPVIVLLATQT